MRQRAVPGPPPTRRPILAVRERRLAGRLALALPAAFLVLALVALLVAPLVGDRYAAPMRRQIREVAEPARSLLTDIHLAVALEGMALHDYQETGDAGYVRQYRDAARRERLAYGRLAALAPRLGADAEAKFSLLRDLERRWHERVDHFIADGERQPGIRGDPRGDPLQAELYEDLLVAAGRLDDTIARAVEFWRQRLLAAEALERRLSLGVGILALGAIVVAVWLGVRLRAYAAEAERRREEVERVLDHKARLIRGLSHDLNNPLHAIGGHTTLLLEGMDGELTPAHRQSVLRIRSCARDMTRLLHDLAEATRAESGQLQIHRTSVALRSVLADLVEEHRAEASVAGHSLCLVTAHDLPAVVTDPDRVRQVLGNLLSNAVKYATPGGEIVVRAEPRTHGRERHRDAWVAVRVADDGPGIPEEQHEWIFDEFTRLHDGDKPGSGLGLAIARRVARLLGGDLTVESSLGDGTTFTLWLPAADPVGASGAAPEGAHPPNRSAQAHQTSHDPAVLPLTAGSDTRTSSGDASWKRWSRSGRISRR